MPLIVKTISSRAEARVALPSAPRDVRFVESMSQVKDKTLIYVMHEITIIALYYLNKNKTFDEQLSCFIQLCAIKTFRLKM